MNVVLQGIGAIIVGAVLIQITLLLISSGRQLVYQHRQRTLALDLLQHRVEIAKARRLEQEETELSWNGFRKFVIKRKVQEAHDIISFYLSPHDSKRLPRFKPGQYLTFKLNIPGNPKPVIRCYSLSDSPTLSDYYRVTIKKLSAQSNNPDLPNGLVSTYFHDRLNEGDILDVKAPSGKFFLDLSADFPIVLVAGGVGITPLLSMLKGVTESQSKREVWLFYGVQNGSHHIMKEYLAQLSREFDNLHLQVCYSQPTDHDVSGKEYHHPGHVTVELFKRVLSANNYEYYICGPPPMMESLTQDLLEWGVPADKILFEAFGPATVRKATAGAMPLPDTPGIEVVFAKSGKKCPWNPQAGSLLEFAESNGITIDFGCRAGNCGTCLTAIKGGEVTYLTDPGTQPEAGSCLTCISVPKGHVTLDA